MSQQLGQPEPDAQRRELLKLVGRVERRVRFQRALERGVTAGVVYLMVMAVVVALHSTGWIGAKTLLKNALLLGVFPAAMILWGLFARVDRIALAQRIDRASGLHDRLSTALSLLESGQDTAFVRAQIQDALAHQDRADTRAAAPFNAPSELLPFAAFAAAIILIALFKPPSHVQPLPEQPVLKYAPILSQSTVELERDRVARLRSALEEINDPELLAMVEEMEELLDDVENQRISEKEFFDRVKKIEETYFDPEREDTADQIADRLKQAAEALEEEAKETLEEHPELKEALDALKEKDLAEASDALEKLAEKLNDEEMSAEEAEKLADLLESFADKIDLEDPKLKELIEEHRELLEELQDKFDLDGDLSAGEKQQLEREKDKLEELEKELENQNKSQATRQLKSMQRAAEDMAEKLKETDGEQGDAGGREGEGPGEDPERAGDEEGSEQDGERGAQDEQDTSGERSSQREAGEMAKDASRALKEGSRQQSSSQMRDQAQRQLEEMKETMRRSSGQRQDESDDQEGGGEEMRKFLQRARGEDPSDEEDEAQRQETGEGNVQKAGGADPGESNEAGEGAGNRELGEETHMDSAGEDSQVDGRDSGGPTRSEIIKAASEEGFATTEYKDVFVDYETVLEEVMDREKVPAGYRYYVKRYFELIQPRDD